MLRFVAVPKRKDHAGSHKGDEGRIIRGIRKRGGEGESVIRLGKTVNKFIRGRRKTSFKGKRDHQITGLRDDYQ
jgi:hypothetical protein